MNPNHFSRLIHFCVFNLKQCGNILIIKLVRNLLHLKSFHFNLKISYEKTLATQRVSNVFVTYLQHHQFDQKNWQRYRNVVVTRLQLYGCCCQSTNTPRFFCHQECFINVSLAIFGCFKIVANKV